MVYDEKGNLKCQVSLDSQGNIYCDGELVISFSVDPVQVLASSPWGDEWSYVYSYTYSTKLRDQISSIVAGVLGLLPSPYGLVITILYVSKQAADFLEQHPDQDYWCIAQVYVNKTYTLYRERVFVYSDSEFQNYLFSADSEPYSTVG